MTTNRIKVPYPEIRYEKPDELIARLDQAWLISDTHLFHNRLWEVLRPASEGGRDPRNTELIIKAWRRLVGPEDIVLHLGDVALGIPVSTIPDEVGYLPGQVWLIPGNHDRSTNKLEVYREMGWKLILPFEADWNGRKALFSHEPIPLEELPADAFNVHGHIHTLPAPSIRHINCCIEQLGYAPVRLQALLDEFVVGLPTQMPKVEGYYVVRGGERQFVPSKRSGRSRSGATTREVNEIGGTDISLLG